jgi:hypothetical protein
VDDNPAIALGVYVRGYPRIPDALDRYLGLTGHRPAIVHVFRNWTDASATFDPALVERVTALGAVPMISWQPPAGDLSAVVRGEHDDYARGWSEAARDWGGRLLLRFAHEMNGEWIPWSTDGTTFRAGWSRLHAIFADAGAHRVAWVWSPHVIDRRAADFTPFYPGHDAVDWVALDGYNWGRSQPGSRWQEFDEIFGDSYARLRALAPDKQMMLAEIGCADLGGDKSAWMRDALLDAIPRRYPAIRGVTWFHADPPGHADWKVDSSPGALAAWREITASPRYAGAISFS